MKAGDEYVFLLTREAQVSQFEPNTGRQMLIPVPYDIPIISGKVKAIGAYGIELDNGIVLSPLSFSKAVPKALFDKKEEAPAEPETHEGTEHA